MLGSPLTRVCSLNKLLAYTAASHDLTGAKSTMLAEYCKAHPAVHRALAG